MWTPHAHQEAPLGPVIVSPGKTLSSQAPCARRDPHNGLARVLFCFAMGPQGTLEAPAPFLLPLQGLWGQGAQQGAQQDPN